MRVNLNWFSNFTGRYKEQGRNVLRKTSSPPFFLKNLKIVDPFKKFQINWNFFIFL